MKEIKLIFFAPTLAASFRAYPLLLGSMGEVALILWLLLGLNGKQWKAQREAAESS